ncbi:site-specific integrase [Sulfuricurvum sp.]|uniref:tyrosine-type recombinase/integrase n=1 Tax=Sulfuricurvum sp. TaxID=2025608 RepID=UPI00262D0FF5|nr:site-specific integrase [Sulfuricurvum sp.]MDD4950745.1 site-specific integrase [Sulfuricurvum sp.]
MKRIKSKGNEGVYFHELANDDRSYFITYKDLDGKKKWIKIGLYSAGIREAYCKQKRDEILHNQRLGEEPPAIAVRKKPTTLKFSEVWEKYIENKAMVDALRNDFKGRYTRYIGPILGTVPANTMNKEHLKKFRIEVQKLSKRKDENNKPIPLSPKSVDMMIIAIGSAYNYWNSQVEKEKDKFQNPVPALRADDKHHLTNKEIQSRDIKRERFLSREEINLLKDAVKNDPILKMFVLASLSTGGRLSTILLIQKTHIDLENRTVTLINTKNGGHKYRGFISDEWYDLLKLILPKMKPYHHIVSNDGNLITDRIIQRPLKKILDELFNVGLDEKDSANRTVVHTLRHTFASHLAINGIPIFTIQKLLDHESIETTLRYAKLSPDSGSDAVRNLKL